MFRTLFFLAATVVTTMSSAHDYKHDVFHADHPWARPTFALATTGAAYLKLDYLGKTTDRLVGASVSDQIADEVQIHDVIMQGDVMQMRQLKTGVAFSAGDSIDFSPGGKHLMLLGLKRPLEDGTEFDMTLHFETADDLNVVVKVENPTDGPQQDHSNHQHHH